MIKEKGWCMYLDPSVSFRVLGVLEVFLVPGGGDSPVGLALFTVVDCNNHHAFGATADRSSLSLSLLTSELSWG